MSSITTNTTVISTNTNTADITDNTVSVIIIIIIRHNPYPTNRVDSIESITFLSRAHQPSASSITSYPGSPANQDALHTVR